MRVNRLPIDPGPAGWNKILPPDASPQRLESTITADWLIVGAGFTGLSAARRLRQLRPAGKIAVLDAQRVAEGPAGRNSGFMIDLPHDLASSDYGGQIEADRQQTRANRAGIAFASTAAAEYGMPDEALVRCGKINAAASEKGLHHNQAYAAHLRAMGEPFDVLDAARMREISGSDYYHGGLRTPGTAMVQPALYIRALARGLQGQGVHLHENSPVLALERRGPDWCATTPRGQVFAPRVILAVNGHTESFGHFRRRLMHVFTYASMTRALKTDEIAALRGEDFWGFTPADPMGTTVRRISGIGGSRILIRNRFTYDPSMMVSDRRIARIAPDHDRAFASRFPMLKDVEMAYRWGGRLCLSRNAVPAFGQVEPGLFIAACQNGLGTAKGTLAGMLAAELAVGQSSAMLREFQAQAQPSRLPPEPVAWLGANAVIRWNESRTGREF